MRVLFATWAEPTHLYSMVPLAWACHAAGHEVRVAAPPTCIAGVARTGLIGVPVGRDVALDQIRNRADLAPWRSPVRWPRGWAADPDLLDAGQHRVLEALADKQCLVADAMAGDLIDFAQSWRPDVIVHDTLTFAGVVAASVLGVPSFAHTWGSSTVIRVEMAGSGLPSPPGVPGTAGAVRGEPGGRTGRLVRPVPAHPAVGRSRATAPDPDPLHALQRPRRAARVAGTGAHRAQGVPDRRHLREQDAAR